MSEQQRCNNNRLYLPPGEYPEGTCSFPLGSKLPFWVEAFAQDAVGPDDGEHCQAWEMKPVSEQKLCQNCKHFDPHPAGVDVWNRCLWLRSIKIPVWMPKRAPAPMRRADGANCEAWEAKP